VTFEELEPISTTSRRSAAFPGSPGICAGTSERAAIRRGRARGRIPHSATAGDLLWDNYLRKRRRSSVTGRFPLPAANSSVALHQPYGVRLGPCNMCGFCERFGCFLYSKASPQTTNFAILADRTTWKCARVPT